MTLDETKLEIFRFGESAEDIFYCLVDLRVSPDGLDLKKLRLTSPRDIDLMFRETGCITMLTGQEVEVLASRGEIRMEDLHTSLFELCVTEGLISAPD